MPAPPLEEMRRVASRLKPLNVPFAFVGGAVMCLLVDHPELTDFRCTNDVDVMVAAITYFEFAALEARLREAGFQHDTSEGAPNCRWIDRSRGSWPPQGRVMRVWEWDGELREGSLPDTRLFKLDLWENEIRLGKGWKRGEWRLSI
jgi:hypothetical protein